MAKMKLSMKQVQINKANSTMIIAVAISAAVIAFSLVAGRALLQKRSYQARVIGAKEKAADQLEANIEAANSLSAAYQTFVSTPENVIGGNPKGTGEKDGDNAKIILDALPSKYDFPALTSSLEKVLVGNNYKVDGITGIDEELAQKQAEQTTPQPVAMPFAITVTTNLDGAKNLLSLFQRSIRPIKVQSVEASGNNNELQLTVAATTYYQPQKTVNIQTEVIK